MPQGEEFLVVLPSVIRGQDAHIVTPLPQLRRKTLRGDTGSVVVRIIGVNDKQNLHFNNFIRGLIITLYI
jgi:hypothetical protein